MPTPLTAQPCQSCGMPLTRSAELGTDSDGFRVENYCRYCYLDGHFTEPAITADDMLEHCVMLLRDSELMPESRARAQMAELLPTLDRWKKHA